MRLYYRPFSLLLAPFLSLCCVAGTINADEYSDARKIISTSDGNVVKWMFPPKIFVLYDRDDYRNYITDVYLSAFEAAKFEIEDVSLTFIDIRKLQRPLPSGVSFYSRANRNGGINLDTFATFRLIGRDRFLPVNSEIFLFILQIEDIAWIATRLKDNNKLLEQFIRGNKTKCFFTIRWDQDSAQVAHIYIRADIEKERMNACLYEEIFQSFGLIADADNSKYFTFDNMSSRNNKKEKDLALLKALYDPRIPHGAPAESVISIYKSRSERR